MVTAELDQKMTQKVCLYEFDDVEMFLKMQKMLAYFLAQQDATKKWNIHDKLEDAVLVKIKAIPGETLDTKELASF